MNTGRDNLAYCGRGLRTYGLKPVLGRARGFWELQWVFRGGARPSPADVSSVGVTSPRLYIFHPDSPHGWTDAGGAVSEVCVLHFREVPPELAALIEPTKSLIIELSDSEARTQRARLEEAWKARETDSPGQRLKLERILLEVSLLALERAGPELARPRPADRVEQALHWFEENLGEHPSAAEAARAAGVSEAHLRRLFAEAGRAAPKTEFTRLRMAVAQRCLREGWKLERIAVYLGFSEASAFSRAFSTACGRSPRAWLKRSGG